MIIIVIFLLSLLFTSIFIAYLMIKAPVGWEDKKGFHKRADKSLDN